MVNSQFSSYWCGYRDNGIPTPLSCIPNYIDTVPLAFGGLNRDSTITTSYLCKDFPEETIQKWSSYIQARGQKVTMSLLDSDQVHWTQVDLEKYANSAHEIVMGKWKLDGFDIDGEGPAIDALAKFVPLLRKSIGSSPVISYTCYTCSEQDTRILNVIKDCINGLQTMNYESDFEGMIAVAKHYGSIVGNDKVSIGVKVGVTPLDQCEKIAQWTRQNGYRGVMLWSVDCDNPTFTGKDIDSWSEAVFKGLALE
jgi:chitinase